jgi:hypothetical protein
MQARQIQHRKEPLFSVASDHLNTFYPYNTFTTHMLFFGSQTAQILQIHVI